MFRKRLYLATTRYQAVVICMNRAFWTEPKTILIINIDINVIIISITHPLFFWRVSHRCKYIYVLISTNLMH